MLQNFSLLLVFIYLLGLCIETLDLLKTWHPATLIEADEESTLANGQ